MYSNTRSLLVSDVMSFPVVTAREKDGIRKVAAKMQKHQIGAVVITNRLNEPVGIITHGDIVRRIVTKKRSLLFTKAKHAMSRPIVAVKKGEKVEDAARLMVNKKVKRLCVVDEGNRLIGIVTDNDIMKSSSYLIDVLNEMINTGYVKEADEAEIRV
jgi:CBS domain-containing protein